MIRRHAHDVTALDGDAEAVGGFLSGSRQATWLHAASSAYSSASDPSLCQLSLHDGSRTSPHVTQHNATHTGLAFLSRCHPIDRDEGGDRNTNSFQIAAATLFAGYESVVAISSTLPDETRNALVDKFYRLMLGGKSGRPDPSKTAAALERAIEELGDEISLENRTNTSHFGI